MQLPIPAEQGPAVRTLAHEYEVAPVLPKGRAGGILRSYWSAYGKWVRERAAYLRTVYHVKECRHEAYAGGQDLRADVLGGRIIVTRDFAPHPLFDLETNQAVRLVHDIDGHAATEQGFTWHEEIIALREQARRTPPQFLPALFAQTLHQLSFTTHNRQFPDVQKVLVSEHGEWRAVLLGSTWALYAPVPSHDDCTECDLLHPHSHVKEQQ